MCNRSPAHIPGQCPFGFAAAMPLLASGERLQYRVVGETHWRSMSWMAERNDYEVTRDMLTATFRREAPPAQPVPRVRELATAQTEDGAAIYVAFGERLGSGEVER